MTEGRTAGRVVAAVLVAAAVALALSRTCAEAARGVPAAAVVPAAAPRASPRATGPASLRPATTPPSTGEETPPAPDAPPGEAPSAQQSLRVVVRDPAGNPVAGASVRVSAADVPSVESATDAEGAVSFRVPPGSEPGVEVRHPYFAAAFERLEPAPVSERTEVVVLRPAATLRGRVVTTVADLPGDVEVLAWPTRFGVSAEALQTARPDDPPVRRVRAASDGSFVFEGLEESGRYLLAVRATGWVCVGGRPAGVVGTPGGPEAVLELVPLYVLDVRLVDADGAVPHVSDEVLASPPTWFGKLPDSAVLVPPSAVSAAVALGPGARPARCAPRLFRLFGAYRDADRIGPITGRVAVPGRRSADLEAWAHRVRGGTWTTQEMRLERAGDGAGTLEIRWSEAAELPARGPLAAPCPTPAACLHLVPADGAADGAAPLELRLPTLGATALVGVPAGRYRVSASIPLGPWRRLRDALPDVTVRAGAVALLDVPPLGTGGARFTVRVADAWGTRPYRGRIRVDVSDPATGGAGQWSFDGAPYAVAGLAPGRYRYRVTTGGHPASPAADLEIVAGRVASADAVLGGGR